MYLHTHHVDIWSLTNHLHRNGSPVNAWFLMGTCMCLVPPVIQKHNILDKMEKGHIWTRNNSSNILVESNCSPRCFPCQPFVIVCTVMKHTDLFERAPNFPHPPCVWTLGKTTAWVCSESLVHAEEPEGWSEKEPTLMTKKSKKQTKMREGRGSKGPAEGILCSASVSCAWQTTWKQFIFLPQTSNPC